MISDEEIIAKYHNTVYPSGPYEDGEGTFRKNKLINKTIRKRVGYHINAQTYELEETE